MISPLVAVASRAALYPIQSIIIIALVVSGAYFHLLDIARNSPTSAISSVDLYLSSTSSAFAATTSTIWGRKQTTGWEWTLDPLPEKEIDVCISRVSKSLTLSRKVIFIWRGDK
jgi:hypothetical protein